MNVFSCSASVSLVILGMLTLIALFFCIRSRSVSDRLLIVTQIHVFAVASVCILAVFYDEAYLLDTALIYALLSFLTVVVLTRMIAAHFRCSDEPNAKEEASHDP